MRKIIISLLMLMSFFYVTPIKAQEFFDKSDASRLFNIGLRLGFNTSDRSFPGGNYYNHIYTSWGLGFNVGAVANINFKEYLSLQPGLFLATRTGNLINFAEYLDVFEGEQVYYAKNHLRAFYVTIPIMGVVKFNITDKLKWSVDLGPYFQYKLIERGQNNVEILYRESYSSTFKHYTAQHNSFDVGFKIGTGLQLFRHYYLGVHYLGGFCNAWSQPEGGKNKSWEFSLGYDF